MAVDRIQGTVKGISSTTKAPAPIEIGAAVRGGGAVTIKGAIDLFDPGRATDLKLGVGRLEIPPLSPMSVHYIGHPVTRGRGEIDLDYKVKDQHLKGSNHIVTQDLTLGDKVAGEGKVNLPIKLGVSILTDKDGRITLDVPVEGRLDDPEFGVGTVIGGVVSGLIKSPFRLLGKIGGGKEGEDLGTVEFPAGSAVLEPASAERLRTLANALKERPELRIVVPGAWDDAADGTALREAALEPRHLRRCRSRVDLWRPRRARFAPCVAQADFAAASRRCQPIPDGGLETLGRARADSVRKALVDASASTRLGSS